MQTMMLAAASDKVTVQLMLACTLAAAIARAFSRWTSAAGRGWNRGMGSRPACLNRVRSSDSSRCAAYRLAASVLENSRLAICATLYRSAPSDS